MLVIGVGNPYREDDGVGRWVAQHLRSFRVPGLTIIEHDGEGTALMQVWAGWDNVLVVDAMRSGAPQGTLTQIDARAQSVPVRLFHTTHSFGVAEAVELARALGELPDRLRIYGIEGGRYGEGCALTPAVLATAQAVVRLIVQEMNTVRHA
jgi:hydrogenase maturation protease